MTDDTLLRRVADDLEIRSVVARLAQLADHGDLDDYVALFTEDAYWNMPGAPRRGRDDIRAGGEARRAAGEAGPGTHTRHVITTVAVDADGSDTATADSYWLFYADTTTAPTLRLCGAYRDSFRRTSSGWKLARRDVSFG